MKAAGVGLGVSRGKVEGRLWHLYAEVPELTYTSSGAVVAEKPLPYMLMLDRPNMPVTNIQGQTTVFPVNVGETDSSKYSGSIKANRWATSVSMPGSRS